jgi:hypothetical protein
MSLSLNFKFLFIIDFFPHFFFLKHYIKISVVATDFLAPPSFNFASVHPNPDPRRGHNLLTNRGCLVAGPQAPDTWGAKAAKRTPHPHPSTPLPTPPTRTHEWGGQRRPWARSSFYRDGCEAPALANDSLSLTHRERVPSKGPPPRLDSPGPLSRSSKSGLCQAPASREIYWR